MYLGRAIKKESGQITFSCYPTTTFPLYFFCLTLWDNKCYLYIVIAKLVRLTIIQKTLYEIISHFFKIRKK